MKKIGFIIFCAGVMTTIYAVAERIPESAATMLFGVGLIGLAMVGRKTIGQKTLAK